MNEQNTKTATEAERVAYWSKVISDWERSGLTKYAFCRINKLNSSGLYAWHKKLKQPDVSQQAAVLKKKATSKPSDSKKPSFIPINVKESPSDPTEQIEHSSFKITLPNGINIQLENATKISLIDCVRALREI